MNELLFVASYLFIAFMGLFGGPIVVVVSVWIGLAAAELIFHLPFAGTLRKFWQKWLIVWPLGKLWGLINKVGTKLFGAAWRGFVIVMKRLGAAAWRGLLIVCATAWRGACRLGSAARARIRGTP